MKAISRQTKIDLKTIRNHFCEAVSSVLQTISGTDVSRPGDKGKELIPASSDFVATIEFKGTINGILGIAIECDLARRLTASLAWSNPEELSDDDIADGVGEIVNQISGRLRTLLILENCLISIATPIVSTCHPSAKEMSQESGRVVPDVFCLENRTLTAFVRVAGDR